MSRAGEQSLLPNLLVSSMSAKLLPERPLIVSPTLASTIGLEEAVMLQTLADWLAPQKGESRHKQPDLKWVAVRDEELQDLFPFWKTVDITRVKNSLQSLGMLLIDPDPHDRGRDYLAIDEGEESSQRSRPQPASSPAPEAVGSASLIPKTWQPDDNWIRLCKQHAIPEAFLRDLVPEFVNYWRDRGHARFSWGNAFYKHAIKEWAKEQTRRGAYEMATDMSSEWWPSQDALEILVNSGISSEFIEDAIPEFVLYWRERGVVHGAWNTKFIEHIRRQWAKFSASFGRDDTPQVIPEDWQPSADCFEILQLAEIDEDYARSRVPEFVLYWRDSQQVKASWNTVFLQFIKQDWARQLKQRDLAENTHAENQTVAGSGQQRLKEQLQRFADRSWAE